jgi:hypothetical protein
VEYILLALTMPLVLLLLLSMALRRRGPPSLVDGGPPGTAPAPQPARGGVPPPVAGFLQAVLPYAITLVAAVLAVVFLNRARYSVDVLQLLLLSRYSLLTAVLLVGLVPLGLVAARGLMGGLFVLRSPWQLFNITWLSVLIAASILITTRVIEHNAPYRYGIHRLQELDVPWGPLQWLILLLLGLPVPVASLVCSLAGPPPAAVRRWVVWVLVGILLGIGIAVLLFGMASALDEIIVADRSELPGLLPFDEAVDAWGLPRLGGLDVVGDALAGLIHWLDPGGRGLVYEVKHEQGGPSWRFARGHLQLLTAMTLVFVFYLGSYFVVTWTGMVPSKNFTFTSLFYLLLLLLLLGLLLQGLAFWLDRFHIPISLVVVLFSFLLYQLNQTDHFFSLNPAGAKPAGPPALPTLGDAVGAWKLPSASRPISALEDAPKDRKTLVVVTASGGGIQAAAWAARVLVGLHQRYGDRFTRSLGLISAVSGGSVGIRYYLDRWQDDPARPVFPADAVAFEPNGRPARGSICDRAMASSLEAAAWGLVFPDLLRTLFPPALVFNRTDDRGGRLEDAWKTRLQSPDARLRDWGGRIRAGTMPVPVFNATIIETGQRFLSSPILGPGTGSSDPVAARELFDLYPENRMRVSTAVRLSATFPFISPICRPSKGECDEKVAYHFADGGYVDNEGMVTAIDWLSRVLASGEIDVRDSVTGRFKTSH